MMHKMTINLDMFGVLMEHIIVSNLNGTSNSTLDRRGSMLRGTKVL
jgi:hypothetical protein